jgi:uncharacterized damage-inducible protein DinB
MAMVDVLLPEFDREMAVTRKVLERVDLAQSGWKPHERSMTLGQLAQHVATIPEWGHTILDQPEFDLVDGSRKPHDAATSAELLSTFDDLVKKVRAVLAPKTDAELMSTWMFKHNGKEMFGSPRAVAWRSWVMSHQIHHRGQLGVYLRLTGSKVPGIYGPSADEQ